MSQKIPLHYSLPAIILSTLLAVAIIYAWTEPTAVPPGDNVPAPINVGNILQTRTGALVLKGVLETENQTLLATQGGNVGIGTTEPTAKLEVAGQIKITGGSPGAGKVLTTDADGLASWQTPEIYKYKLNNQAPGKTPTPDNDLKFTIGPGETWQFELVARGNLDGQGFGMSIGWLEGGVPAGAGMVECAKLGDSPGSQQEVITSSLGNYSSDFISRNWTGGFNAYIVKAWGSATNTTGNVRTFNIMWWSLGNDSTLISMAGTFLRAKRI